jgi:hypothetical protein
MTGSSSLRYMVFVSHPGFSFSSAWSCADSLRHMHFHEWFLRYKL